MQLTFVKKKGSEKAILIIATGRIPFAPGTFGTLAGLPLIGIMVWLATACTPGATALFLVGVIRYTKAFSDPLV